MNILQYHASVTCQISFQEIVRIEKSSENSYHFSIIDIDGDIRHVYVCPFFKWEDNMPDSLFLDGKTYSENDLYTFCFNWITENILNTLEAGND